MTEDEIRGTTMAVSGLNMIEDKTIEMEGKEMKDSKFHFTRLHKDLS